ncbi:hypothetical protein C0W52_03595 [Photobacterium kishitanii]|uniref:Fe/B12 periplasmic-binding domain-containing protein n=1 Tax=Photobacterium kishitanii TaxID=318456 RepID=A0AAX0YXX4_9GAMM|nr:hypothetical protein CTM84_06830 [Photobacterium kishitanii]PSV10659.1 hypothetical protein C0W59_20840 [Photobacterium kishitanii]PSW50709.1 hypothetical protein C0W66_02715 [Photobacterium kishitanii]PSX18080.1 hypothetical protein C0W70_16160 [Photobacterium kishitanii]PSX30442.1 hypothetical protein C0W52_03595 [Photobacterium kishitanii]
MRLSDYITLLVFEIDYHFRGIVSTFTCYFRKHLCLLAIVLSINVFAEPVTYTDQAGRKVEIPKTPERISVVATPAGTMVVALDGSGDRLVATTTNSKNAINEGVLNEFFPILNKISDKVVGKDDSPNIEALLNLNTDLVIQWARKNKSIEAMEAAGLNVAAMQYKKTDIAKTWLNDMGIILNKSQKAKEILDWQEKTYQNIVAKTKYIEDKNKPSVLYLMDESSAASSESHFQFYIDTAGAKNAIKVKGNIINIDPEMILNANPDIIWLFGFNINLKPNDIYTNPIYSEIKAVKNHHVYKVPVGGDRWDPPNQELALALEWFTRTVHPNILPGSMREHLKSALEFLYGKEATDEQLDIMLRAEINKDASGYKGIIN